MKILSIDSIKSVKKNEWDNLVSNESPLFNYEFLLCLENSLCTNLETGWQPNHFIFKKNENISSIIPAYKKFNSNGEFVFDHSWAQAYQSLGLNYYPKLLIASPFSPVTGKRILVTPNANDRIKKKLFNFIKDFCKEKEISSIHIFP